MNEIDFLKKILERAFAVDSRQKGVGKPGTPISVLGLLLPSHLWSSDADDMIDISPKDIDDANLIMETWFRGLDRREKLSVLFITRGMDYKKLALTLKRDFNLPALKKEMPVDKNARRHFRSMYCRAMLYIYYTKGLKKVLVNAKNNGFFEVFKSRI